MEKINFKWEGDMSKEDGKLIDALTKAEAASRGEISLDALNGDAETMELLKQFMTERKAVAINSDGTLTTAPFAIKAKK